MLKNLSIGTSLVLLFAGCNKGSQSNDSVSTGAPADVKLAKDRNLYSSGSGVEGSGQSSSSFGHEPKGSMEPTVTKTNVSFRPPFPDTMGVTPSGTGGLIPPAVGGSYESKHSIEDGGANAASNPTRQEAVQEVQGQANTQGNQQQSATQNQQAAAQNPQPQGSPQPTETGGSEEQQFSQPNENVTANQQPEQPAAEQQPQQLEQPQQEQEQPIQPENQPAEEQQDQPSNEIPVDRPE